MIVISFDVGIKNLAYCLLSMNEAETETETETKAGAEVDGKNFIEIIKWNIIDLSCDHVEETEEAKILNAKKSCCKCKKAATYCTHSNTILPEDVEQFCKKHAEETGLPMHPKLLKSNSKVGQTPYMVPLSKKKVSCNKINIVDLGKSLKSHLDFIFAEYMDKINVILIENQIGNLAGRMNVLQGMISQYFIMRNITHIEFISATNKLKLFKTIINKKSDAGSSGGNLDNVLESEKKLYKMRKDAGKNVCRSLLSFYPLLTGWITKYDQHKKNDDLADCFLQGYYYAHLQFKSVGFDLDSFLSNYQM
jgi:hypothetical protein